MVVVGMVLEPYEHHGFLGSLFTGDSFSSRQKVNYVMLLDLLILSVLKLMFHFMLMVGFVAALTTSLLYACDFWLIAAGRPVSKLYIVD